jgi:hypothetical protein
MGMLRFSDAPPEVFVVPRLEDELIDELFYQEEEIGEFRYSAFMIECGLEEDPPDGPDVKPIPWLDNYSDSSSSSELSAKALPPLSPKKEKRVLTKTSSMDDVGVVEVGLSPTKREPRRGKLVACKSGTLHGMRKKIPVPGKSHSSSGVGDHVGLPLARTETESGPVSPVRGRRLVAVKSGSLHGMRKAAKAEKANEDDISAPRRKLVATKSGTRRAMSRKLTDVKQATEEGSDSHSSPTVKRGSLIATKSGSGLRRVRREDWKASKEPPKEGRAPNGIKASLDRKSSNQLKKSDSSDDDSESFSDVDSASGDSNVSIATDEGSGEPAPKKKGSTTTSTDKKDKAPKAVGRISQASVGPRGSENISAALKNLRTGKASPAELLRNMQIRPTVPKKAASVSALNVPTPFRSPGDRARPGKLKMPKKAKSSSVLDIPPAFRAMAK